MHLALQSVMLSKHSEDARRPRALRVFSLPPAHYFRNPCDAQLKIGLVCLLRICSFRQPSLEGFFLGYPGSSLQDRTVQDLKEDAEYLGWNKALRKGLFLVLCKLQVDETLSLNEFCCSAHVAP